MRELSFLYTFGERPAVWWDATSGAEQQHHGLDGRSQGARKLLKLSHAQLERLAVETLAKVMGMEVEAVRQEVAGFYRHDWQADKLAGGAYSYVASGGLGAAGGDGGTGGRPAVLRGRAYGCNGALGNRACGDAFRPAGGSADSESEACSRMKISGEK